MKQRLIPLMLACLAGCNSLPDMNKAAACYKEKDYRCAFSEYSKAAEQGDLSALSNLGLMYEKGYGVKKDYAEALERYFAAAKQGYVSGQVRLAALYEVRYGEYLKAVEWYRKAVEQDNAEAQYRLGEMYLSSRGVVKDNEKARELIQKAAEQGYKEANEWLLNHPKFSS